MIQVKKIYSFDYIGYKKSGTKSFGLFYGLIFLVIIKFRSEKKRKNHIL